MHQVIETPYKKLLENTRTSPGRALKGILNNELHHLICVDMEDDDEIGILDTAEYGYKVDFTTRRFWMKNAVDGGYISDEDDWIEMPFIKRLNSQQVMALGELRLDLCFE